MLHWWKEMMAKIKEFLSISHSSTNKAISGSVSLKQLHWRVEMIVGGCFAIRLTMCWWQWLPWREDGHVDEHSLSWSWLKAFVSHPNAWDWLERQQRWCQWNWLTRRKSCGVFFGQMCCVLFHQLIPNRCANSTLSTSVHSLYSGEFRELIIIAWNSILEEE